MSMLLGTPGSVAHANVAGHGPDAGCANAAVEHHRDAATPDISCCCLGMCLGLAFQAAEPAAVAAEKHALPEIVPATMTGFHPAPPRPPPKARHLHQNKIAITPLPQGA
jgi:hypothetical protein